MNRARRRIGEMPVHGELAAPAPRLAESEFVILAALLISMVALAIGGQMHLEQLRAALVWLPFLFAGYLLSGPVKRRLDHARMRRSVLAFCAISSVVVILRALVL